jgi:starch phosphorylase
MTNEKSPPHDLKDILVRNLRTTSGRTPEYASKIDWYQALALTVRERVYGSMDYVMGRLREPDGRLVAYLSAEFLLGPHLRNHILNLDLRGPVEAAMKELGLTLEDILNQEEEPGLGNGGLGRLAACYLDSLATLGIPAKGYGIRYEFGIFDQVIRDGAQVEVTDKWLKRGNPWEIPHPDIVFTVGFGGKTESVQGQEGRLRTRWVPNWVVNGVAYDTPMTGYRSPSAALLRLWKAEAVESFDFAAYNSGDYFRAVQEKIASENISKVLYPNDEGIGGKRLRLEQQYFFVSCTLQDLIRVNLALKNPLTQFHKKFAVQLNDTHPSIAVAELMRLLVDVHGMEWEEAWTITRESFHYTNHTLLPEALEKWPLELFGSLLPRHLEIIYEINRRFLDQVRRDRPGDDDLVRRVSLIDEGGQRYVRMAHLAAVGSRAINGVAQLHTDLLKQDVLRDFHSLYPQKILNITNGVTPRRFMASANPGLARLITEAIGDRWILYSEEELPKLAAFARDAAFQEKWRTVKRENKKRLASLIEERTDWTVDPDTLFDVQVKRIHEYKRQHLSVLHIIRRYLDLKECPSVKPVPRTFIFGGKAAPGYFMAKLMIRFINAVAGVVNRDPAARGIYRIVFFPDFNVKNGEYIYPAAELSEQISTAGKEASGTGNMKFTLNGALTVGTLDGANVEIREAVGAENFFLFGKTVPEVQALWRAGYDARRCYESDPRLSEVLDLVSSGHFSPSDRGLFRPLVDSLLYHDPYLLLTDFPSYIDVQSSVDNTYRNGSRWTEMSILNVAGAGRFSSDRSVRDYAREIWNIPLPKRNDA